MVESVIKHSLVYCPTIVPLERYTLIGKVYTEQMNPGNNGRPLVLVVDATQNLQGWEQKASDRVFRSMKRRKVQVLGAGPERPTSPSEFEALIASWPVFNCLILAGQGRGDDVDASAALKSYWDVLRRKQDEISLAVVATWTCGRPDPRVKEEVIRARDLAPIALASEEDLNAHEAFVFFSRFFEELDLHCPTVINAPMARFAYIKTRHFAKGKMEIRY